MASKNFTLHERKNYSNVEVSLIVDKRYERKDKKYNICNNVNYHLKKMSKELGFKKEVTPTYARHSFATILRRQPLEVPETFVEYSMGHSLKGSASNYFGGFTTDLLLKYSAYLVA